MVDGVGKEGGEQEGQKRMASRRETRFCQKTMRKRQWAEKSFSVYGGGKEGGNWEGGRVLPKDSGQKRQMVGKEKTETVGKKRVDAVGKEGGKWEEKRGW